MFPDIMHIMKKNKASGREILKAGEGILLHRVVRAGFEALMFKGRLQWKDRVKHEKVWNLEEESEWYTGGNGEEKKKSYFHLTLLCLE